MSERFAFEPQRYVFIRKLPKILKFENGKRWSIFVAAYGRLRSFFQDNIFKDKITGAQIMFMDCRHGFNKKIDIR
jgi:hypothetical protein